MNICPECGSDNLIKFGYTTKARKQVPQWRCKNCLRITSIPKQLPDRNNKGQFTKRSTNNEYDK